MYKCPSTLWCCLSFIVLWRPWKVILLRKKRFKECQLWTSRITKIFSWHLIKHSHQRSISWSFSPCLPWRIDSLLYSTVYCFYQPLIADSQTSGTGSCAMRGIIAAPNGTCLSKLARNHPVTNQSHKTLQFGGRSCIWNYSDWNSHSLSRDSPRVSINIPLQSGIISTRRNASKRTSWLCGWTSFVKPHDSSFCPSLSSFLDWTSKTFLIWISYCKHRSF